MAGVFTCLPMTGRWTFTESEAIDPPEPAAALLVRSGAPAWRDQVGRNLAWPELLSDTEGVQAAEVGRMFSGVFKPD